MQKSNVLGQEAMTSSISSLHLETSAFPPSTQTIKFYNKKTIKI